MKILVEKFDSKLNDQSKSVIFDAIKIRVEKVLNVELKLNDQSNSVINDTNKILADKIYWKSEIKFNKQNIVSQNTKGARYRSESVINNRNSHRLFIFDQISAMRVSLKQRGTFHEPVKYNILLIIIAYLLNLSHYLLMKKMKQGEGKYISPTKSKTVHIQTLSEICCKNRDSNYHVWANSKFQNVCQVTNSLLLATNIIWASSKYQNVYKLSKLLLLAMDIIWDKIAQWQFRPIQSIQGISSQKLGDSSSRKLAALKISNFISGGSSCQKLAISKMADFTSGGSPSRNLADSEISNVKIEYSSNYSLALPKISNFVHEYSSNYSLALQDIFNFVHGGSSNYNLALPNISKFTKVLYNIQWSPKNYGTSQEKETRSRIQWPPEKIATMQTVANYN